MIVLESLLTIAVLSIITVTTTMATAAAATVVANMTATVEMT